MRATLLGPAHRPALAALLGADPAANLFLLDRLAEGGLQRSPADWWAGAFDRAGALRAVLYAAGPLPVRAAMTAIPAGEAEDCAMLGELLAAAGGTRLLVGPRGACDAVWVGLGRPSHRTRHDQRLYVAEAVGPGPAAVPTPARPSDVDALQPMHLGLLAEDLGVTEEEIDAPAHRADIARRVRAGKVRVLRETDDGPPVFAVDIGTVRPEGVQVGGTFVRATARGQGWATRGMRGLVVDLLPQTARVTLHCNEANAPAVRAYEAAGFRPAAPFRLMVLEGGPR